MWSTEVTNECIYITPSPYMSEREWCILGICGDLFEYYLHRRCWLLNNEQGQEIIANDRETFFRELTLDLSENQTLGWMMDTYDHLKHLYPAHMNYEPVWPDDHASKLVKDVVQNEYENLIEERETFQTELDDLKLIAYHNALKGEASRLKCDISDVRSICPILPLAQEENCESKLISLPHHIFSNVMNRLDTIDIFRLTLASKKLRNIVRSNSKGFKRAEHSFLTHLITFKDWMDHGVNKSCLKLIEEWRSYSWNVVKWYCTITKDLETLILDHKVIFHELVQLLQSCPKLRNLILGHTTMSKDLEDAPFTQDLHFPNLEVFFFEDTMYDPSSAMISNIFKASHGVTAFRGSLDNENIQNIRNYRPINHVFRNMIALDLNDFTIDVLETLSLVDDLQLKYLRLGEIFFDSINWNQGNERARTLFENLLPKLKNLEILIGIEKVGMTNDTLELIIRLKLNLYSAIIYEPFLYGRQMNARDRFEPTTLIAFKEMLCSKRPDVNLDKFFFYVQHRDTEEVNFLNDDIGFKNIRSRAEIDEHREVELSNPTIRRYLGIEF
eukprot:g8230.t1